MFQRALPTASATYSFFGVTLALAIVRDRDHVQKTFPYSSYEDHEKALRQGGQARIRITHKG